MMELVIDFETRSCVDIKKCGMYVYWQNPYTEIMMLSIKKDSEDAKVWIPRNFRDIKDTEIEDSELESLIQEAEIIIAHNAGFERQGFKYGMSKLGFSDIPLEKVRCTMAQAAACALPLNLDSVAKIVSGGKNNKDDEGHKLMLKMSKPRAFVKKECEDVLTELIAQGKLPETTSWKDVKKIQAEFLGNAATGEIDKLLADKFLIYRCNETDFCRLVEYARQDCQVERAVYDKLPKLTEEELEVWRLNERINDRGINIDRSSSREIKDAVNLYTDQLTANALKLTEGEVTSMKSPSSILSWLRTKGIDTDSIDKEAVAFLLTLDLPEDVKEFLEIRQKTGKSSVAKYNALLNYSGVDGRARGLFAYHVATTGRFASKGIQLQNLPRPSEKNFVKVGVNDDRKEVHADELDIPLLVSKDYPLIDMFWQDTMVLASDLIRPMLMAQEGHEFICSDFSAVEARGLAWLAGQEDILDAFRKGLDIYKTAASGIFKIPYGQVDGGGKGAQRQIGKTAILACFAPETEVLTNLGWVKIVDITKNHKLWDGLSWVEHGGVIFSGLRKTVGLDGIRVTPDHLMFDGISWKTVSECIKNPQYMQSVRLYGESAYLMSNLDNVLQDVKKCGQSENLSKKSSVYEPVYDIMNVGKNNRFLVRGDTGFFMAHNCGYGGGYGAMLRFGADKLGIDENEGKEIVRAWRKANDKIVKFWYALRDGSMEAMKFPGDRIKVGKVSFRKRGSFLTLRLPSGRDLFYPNAKVEMCEMPWLDEVTGLPDERRLVTAMTLTAAKQWVRRPLNHVTLSENVTQATCRDLLANAMFNVEKAGYPIVAHIHDEILSEVPTGYGSVEEFEKLMAKLPSWAEGFPLVAAGGYRSNRYRK